LGRSTRIRGRRGRTEGANKIRARLIHPSHWLGSTHPRCGPHERRIHRDPPAAGGPEPPAQADRPPLRSTRATGSSRSTPAAIHPSHRLKPIDPRCDPPEPPAQADQPPLRSTQATVSTRSPRRAIDPSVRLGWPSHGVKSIIPWCDRHGPSSEVVDHAAQVDRTPVRSTRAAGRCGSHDHLVDSQRLLGGSHP
jgi:hypothetical protein